MDMCLEVSMSRYFVYDVEPKIIQSYLESLGYEVKHVFDQNGQPIRFDVLETTIQLAYDTFINGRIVSPRTISMKTIIDQNGSTINEETKKELDSLYKKLYRRFRKQHS